MGTSMSDRLREYSFTELCNTEAMNNCLDVLESSGLKMTPILEETILNSVSKFIEQYNLNETFELVSISMYKDDTSSGTVETQPADFFIKATDVTAVFEKIQTRAVSMLVGLVASELVIFLLAEARNKNDKNN